MCTVMDNRFILTLLCSAIHSISSVYDSKFKGMNSIELALDRDRRWVPLCVR